MSVVDGASRPDIQPPEFKGLMYVAELKAGEDENSQDRDRMQNTWGVIMSMKGTVQSKYIRGLTRFVRVGGLL